jgi:hypothetical protein
MSTDQSRPEFMAKLGLLPPYTLEDIDTVYREKVMRVHPDRGGSVAEFNELKDAVDCARAHVQMRQGRRQWLAVNVDRYARQEEVCAEIRRRGGQADLEQINWMKQSLGDFAVVTERLRGIRLLDHPEGDEFLDYLGRNRSALEYLVRLDLAGCRMSDGGLAALGQFPGLKRLDISRTPITEAGVSVLGSLPNLEWINLADTGIGCWARFRLRRTYRRLVIANARRAP